MDTLHRSSSSDSLRRAKDTGASDAADKSKSGGIKDALCSRTGKIVIAILAVLVIVAAAYGILQIPGAREVIYEKGTQFLQFMARTAKALKERAAEWLHAGSLTHGQSLLWIGVPMTVLGAALGAGGLYLYNRFTGPSTKSDEASKGKTGGGKGSDGEESETEEV